MIDNPEKTARLLASLKAAVPFKVELVPSLVTYLRSQHVAFADQTQHVVSNLSYAGDEGGIVCHIAPPDKEEALVLLLSGGADPSCAFTQLAMSPATKSVPSFSCARTSIKPILVEATATANPVPQRAC